MVVDQLAAALRRARAPVRWACCRLHGASAGGEGDDACEQPLDAALTRVLVTKVGGDVRVDDLVVVSCVI
jgi:hypothetical protein